MWRNDEVLVDTNAQDSHGSDGINGIDGCIARRVERQAALTPDAVAVRCGTVRLTYAELDRRANRVARCLAGLPFCLRGDTVGI